MFKLTLLLVLLTLLHYGYSNDCNPAFADTCFTEVSYDLKFMLNLRDMVAKNISTAAVNELCLALDDSLNCTEDIIDEDCGDSVPRKQFESWIKALRGALTYVCQGKDHSPLKMLLRATPCWSIEDFILCCEEHLGLTHVRDLLFTEINELECKKLHKETRQCSKLATVGSCREQDEIEEAFEDMISEFFWASECRKHSLSRSSAHTMSISLSFTTLILFGLWLL